MTNTIDNIFKHIFEKIDSMPVEELDSLLAECRDDDGITVNEFLQDYGMSGGGVMHHVDISASASYSRRYTVASDFSESFDICASELVECAA